MDATEFPLKAGKQVLHAIAWLPDAPMRAGIALVHGQGEHCGRYDHFAEFFNDQGIGVMGIDHAGHGLTAGARGHVARYDDYLDGVEALVAEWKRREPGLPVFLYGQSMGGNIAANFLLRRQGAVLGGICSSAWFQLAFKPPAFKLHLASLMVRILPSYSESNGLNADDLSRDPIVGRDYRNDPLVHDKISAGAFFGIHQAGQWALDHADSLQVPVLVMHGAADKLTSAPASKAFAEKAGPLARYVEWSGAYHELHNETNRMEVLRCALNWMEERLAGR